MERMGQNQRFVQFARWWYRAKSAVLDCMLFGTLIYSIWLTTAISPNR